MILFPLDICIPKTRIAGLYSSSSFNFKSNLYTVFHRSYGFFFHVNILVPEPIVRDTDSFGFVSKLQELKKNFFFVPVALTFLPSCQATTFSIYQPGYSFE